MLKISEIKNIYPVIMTPSHDGKFFGNYVMSLISLQSTFDKLGIPLSVYAIQGESLITRARNNSVAAFLENKEWTHLFWIDSDIGFQPEAVLRLLLSDYDIAAGIYPLKFDNWPEEGLPKNMTEEQFSALYTKYPVNTDVNESNEVNLTVLENGFLEVSQAPTGFMVIKRHVFEKMMKEYPELQYIPNDTNTRDSGLYYRFFDTMVDPKTKHYYSEDYGFCYLWKKLGGKIYIDGRSELTHQGNKIYTGKFLNSLFINFANAIGTEIGAKVSIKGRKNLINF